MEVDLAQLHIDEIELTLETIKPTVSQRSDNIFVTSRLKQLGDNSGLIFNLLLIRLSKWADNLPRKFPKSVIDFVFELTFPFESSIWELVLASTVQWLHRGLTW
jgi:hypothetical protein